MRRLGLLVLILSVVLLVVPPQTAVRVDASSAACPPEGCSLFLPLVRRPGKLMKVGLVADTGGIQDGSFSQAAWQGVLDAQEILDVTGAYLQSNNQSDYTTHINTFISQGYDLIVTVGFAMADATKAAAQAHPTQKFTIVDVTYDPILPNVIGQTYSSEQAAFLSGYLAAGTTLTGKVAVFGGMNIPPVTMFMNGYYQGVAYYNQQNETDVEVLGWNPSTQEGEFTNDFTNQSAGLAMGQKLLNQGADIIFPVAGVVGLGAAQAVQAQPNAWIIGVDTDWTLTAPAYASVVLTSALKNSRAATTEVINLAYQNNFTGGNYVGTLANQGVGLGKISPTVQPALLTKVKQVRNAIIAGTIIVTP